MVGVAAAGTPVDYASQVKPILTRHCVSCHGATKPRGGLRLDTAAAALMGGKSGPVVLPGRGEESPLIAAVRGEGESSGCLETAAAGRGRDQAARSLDRPGAQGDRRRAARNAPRRTGRSSHPKRPVVPEVSKPGWARNPIDRFILAGSSTPG